MINRNSYFLIIFYLLIGIILFSCSKNPIINYEIDRKPMWPQYGYDGRNSGNPYVLDTYIPAVISTNYQWIDTLQKGTAFVTPTIDSKGNIYYIHSIHPYTNCILYKFDFNGKIIWTLDGLSSNNSAGLALSSDETKIYFSIFSGLYCVDSSGILDWRIPATFSISSKPAIGEDGTIYACLGNPSELYSVTPDGNIKWKAYNAIGAPALDKDNNIYVPYYIGEYGVARFDNTGKLIWTYTLIPSNLGTFGVVIDGNNNIYFASGNWSGEFTSLNKDGELRWRIPPRPGTFAIVNCVPAITKDNKIYTSFVIKEASDSYACIVLYDTSGVIIWKRNIVPISISDSFDPYLLLDSEDNVYGSDHSRIVSLNKDGVIRFNKYIGWGLVFQFALSPNSGFVSGGGTSYPYKTLFYLIN